MIDGELYSLRASLFVELCFFKVFSAGAAEGNLWRFDFCFSQVIAVGFCVNVVNGFHVTGEPLMRVLIKNLCGVFDYS